MFAHYLLTHRAQRLHTWISDQLHTAALGAARQLQVDITGPLGRQQLTEVALRLDVDADQPLS